MATEEVDYWRQLDIFSPKNFTTSITIIGAGATGSYIAWLLAKMGCRDITVYDADKIENHNLPNQIYGIKDIGKKKVLAIICFPLGLIMGQQIIGSMELIL